MYNPDPYDCGIPKYSTAQAIYDGLCELVNTEEMGILGEMFSDVSWDGQDYYYTEKGYTLKEQFEELSGYGEKMWIMDLAVWQIDKGDVHDFVYQALCNEDMAKRLGFKKLFVKYLLYGNGRDYDQIAEEFLNELQELNRFDYYQMVTTFAQVMANRGHTGSTTPYPAFCQALYEKCSNLRLPKETQIVAESRALLTSYDDFMYGLRMNQALNDALERQYQNKVAQLEAAYKEKVQQLYLLAAANGISVGHIEVPQPLVQIPEMKLTGAPYGKVVSVEVEEGRDD